MKLALGAAALALCGACASSQKSGGASGASGGGEHKEAVAKIEAKSGSNVSGTATFKDKGDKTIEMVLDVVGLEPGQHAVHLHQKGDCSDATGDAAGPHWNPTKKPHGVPPGEHHAGDTGMLTADAGGKATHTYVSQVDEWTIGAGTSTITDIIGKAVIIHAKPDDGSQPSGNAGQRIGCGVITAK